MSSTPPPPQESGINPATWERLGERERARIEQALHERAKVESLAETLFEADKSKAAVNGPPDQPLPDWPAAPLNIRAYYLDRAFLQLRPVSLTEADLASDRPAVIRSILDGDRSRQDRAYRFVRKATKYGLRGLLVLTVVLIGWLAWTAPLSQSLQPIAAPSFLVLAADGQPIARRGAVRSDPVDVMALPPYVGQAFVAIEDRRFFHHVGIDPWGIGRALLRNFSSGHLREGGSTISQQLAKTSFTGGERTLARKAQEALITLWLEARLSKEEILSRYISNVHFGNNVYGLRAAAHYYFNVTPEQLTLAQAAMLAGLVNAPNRLAPNRNLEGAQARSELVLHAMVELGFITQQQYDATQPARLRLAPSDNIPTGTYFADWILSGIESGDQEQYGEHQVQTTLERNMQRAAIQAVRGAGLGNRQAALVAMHTDGRIVAMIGGRDYARSPFNRATMARRQAGSTFKLFVYLAALRAGMTPDSMVEDRPITIGHWSPHNASGTYQGQIPLRDAFAISSNVAAVRLAQRVGLNNVIQAARDLGVTAPIPANDPSIALGTADVSLLEMTSAYAAVASGRYPIAPRGLVETPADAGIFSTFLHRVAAPTQNEPAFDNLRALLGYAVAKGTGHGAELPVLTFGKTGTTQDSRDALFIGFAGDLVVGIWVGNDDNRPMEGVSGGGLPARIWHNFMMQALNLHAAAPVAKKAPDAPGPNDNPDQGPGFVDRIEGLARRFGNFIQGR